MEFSYLARSRSSLPPGWMELQRDLMKSAQGGNAIEPDVASTFSIPIVWFWGENFIIEGKWGSAPCRVAQEVFHILCVAAEQVP